MKNLISWFTGLDTQMKAIMALVGVGLIVIGVATALHVVDTLTETAEQKGAVTERAETQGKVIENVKAAKDAGEAVRRDGGPSRDDCLRDSRIKANC
ncbi:hypothetical protein MNQ96_01345 [Sphingopyxis granuli]|uniref:hypothetical protein n=1 Tax=Sphingopyxis granuli TaxID=267128 RepID=UPI001F536CD6|nr:hypothetical protein [Sphingopyxis granuli]UNK79768.1 hypothetical protein MNQ96_01345 [Sphingopyxis granuli]